MQISHREWADVLILWIMMGIWRCELVSSSVDWV